MRKRIHLRKRINFKFHKGTQKWFLIFFLLTIAVIFSFRFINKKVTPVMMEYASVEAQNISSLVMNKAISENISAILNMDELFIISRNTNNEINMIDFNPLIVNGVLTKITNIIHEELHNLEMGNTEYLEFSNSLFLTNSSKRSKGILFEIPSGVVFNNPLLSNLGPKIPVQISFIGDIISNIDTKVTNYGINNALIEVNLHLEVTAKVLLPITTKETLVELSIPLALKLIQGNIPNYYLNGFNGSSSVLTVPVE